jgi:hypothetical protein
VNEHQTALREQLDAALAEIGTSADASRAVIDGDIEALHELNASAGRPPSMHALIPDTPLVDSAAGSAFDDDAPLWQS